MLKSLRLYSEYFIKSALSPDRKYVIHDVNRFLLRKNVFSQELNFSDSDRNETLKKGINWLITAQKVNTDGGMGSYHLINKWSSSYPETTGYIIPTLIWYGKRHNDPEAIDTAVRAADFLLKIQKPSGGWQGGRMNDYKPEIVFNTGQVIRGMIEAYQLTGQQKYLESAVKAGKWLSEIQHPEGYWKTHALMNQPRVYDTFVDVPLLSLYEITRDDLFKNTAIRNLNWVVNEKMKGNGWFEDCDNTVKRNDKPILHTIAYTLDGLIDSSLVLKEDKYFRAAETGSLFLRDSFLADGFLNGRFDRDWNGSEFIICTGCAQMASVWLKLFRISGDKMYRDAASKMINLLIFIVSRKISEDRNTLGALPGSFPLWGRYEPFAFPNWATKFFCDALMLENEAGK